MNIILEGARMKGEGEEVEGPDTELTLNFYSKESDKTSNQNP